MNKIIRTPTKASGGVTEEEKVLLKKHSDMWTKRILRTEATEFDKLESAIKGLYRVSDLAEPEVVLVKSPLAMAFMFGTLSVLSERKKFNRSVIDQVHEAFDQAAGKPNLVDEYKQICLEYSGKKGISATKEWYKVYQGGAYWAQYDAFLTAMRDVIGLKLEVFEKYKYWEEAAIWGTFRVMHEKFCIVSDFPLTIKMDDENRPHCQDGPSHKWRDGWEFYYWHGVMVPKHWIMEPKQLTAKEAITWANIEERRAACEILGWAKILQELNAKVIDTDGDPEIGELVEVDLPDIGKEKFLRVLCGTGREFALPVPPDMTTALQAQAWTWGLDEKTFIKPEVRT